MCQSSVASGCYFTHFRVKMDFGSSVRFSYRIRRFYEPLVFDSHWFGVLAWYASLVAATCLVLYDFLGEYPALFPHSALICSTVLHVWRQSSWL